MKILKKIKSVILISVVLALMIISFSGCSGSMSYVYDNASKYSAGDRDITDKIENIEIDYLTGTVTIVGGASDTISIKETSDKKLEEKQKVHTYVDDDTLYVKFCASSNRINFDSIEKDLVIYIPDNIKLEDVSVSATAADFSSGGIVVEDMEVNTASGDVSVDSPCEKLTINVVSGSVDVNTHDVEKMSVNVVSGSSKFVFSDIPEKAEVGTVSGNVDIYIPEKSNVTIDANTKSGDVDCSIDSEKKGSKYIIGDGDNKIDLETISGDINIKRIGGE